MQSDNLNRYDLKIERASVEVESGDARHLVSFGCVHDKVSRSLLAGAYAHSFLLQNTQISHVL